MKKVFVNPDDNRLRAGWRILIFIIIFMAIALTGQVLVKTIAGGIPGSTNFIRNAILISIAAISASIAVPVARHILDKKSFISLGLQKSRAMWKDLVFGFFLSGAMAGLVFAVMVSSGLVEIRGINWGGHSPMDANAVELADRLAMMSIGPLFFFLLIDLLISWWEELVFRGYLLQNMIDGLGLIWAVAASCIIYGLVHSANPNAGWLSTIIIIFFGYLRIYGFLATKQLWLSMGMHAGWNFFQGPVFGYAASGQRTATIISQQPVGPDWLSGGDFGPEGSVLVIPVLILALGAMRWWAGKTASERNHIMAVVKM